MSVTPETRRSSHAIPSLESLSIGLVAAFILCIPFALKGLVVVSVHSPHFERPLLGTTTVGILEVLSITLAIAAIPVLLRRELHRTRPVAVWGILGLTAVTAIGLIVAPSAEGVARLIRLAGISGLVTLTTVMGVTAFRNAVVWPLTISAAIQGCWALAQTFVFRDGDISFITERFGHAWTQGRGSMDGGYALAAFMVLSIAVILASARWMRLHPVMWGTVIIASAAISATFGRSGVVAVLGIAGVYGLGAILRRNRDHLVRAIAAGAPMLCGVAVTWAGWSVRASETIALDQSGRVGLLDRAFEMIRANPLLGVGPGNYGRALADMGLTPTDVTAVHNVPILIAAEYGLPVGVFFTVWLIALGVIAARGGAHSLALFAALVPYLVFDHPHLEYAYGVAEFGVWLGALGAYQTITRFSRDGLGAEAAPAHDVLAVRG